MLLIGFDLPRYTKRERRQATQFQKRLVDLGFTMKQFSLYEREVKKLSTKEYILRKLQKEIPDYGSITLYVLPDEVNNEQITILGKRAFKKSSSTPEFITI